MRLRCMRGIVRVAVTAMTTAAMTASMTASMTLAAQPVGAASSEKLWIVELEPGASPGTEGRAIARQHGGEARHIYEHALNGYSFAGSERQAAALARHPKVRRVEADQPVQALAQATPTGIRRVDADGATAAGHTGAGAVVAVIDTGVDLDHPDLAANINSTGKDCVNNDAVAQDDDGHGTHVAGTIAALDNTAGVVGVGPAIKIEPVKVLDANGSGTWAGVICGIDYVTSKATTITVANMSLGGSSGEDATNCASSTLHQAICNSVNAGIFYAVSAGNNGGNASGQVPAKYDQVTTVSALEDTDGAPGGLGGCVTGGPPSGRYCDDAFATFSNYGSAVDVVAPGVKIHSTYWNNTYATASGTSMASPHVAGVAALVRAAQPSLTPAAVKFHLAATGQCPNGTTSGAATCSGKGTWPRDPDGITEPLVNALVATAGDAPPPPSNEPPTASFDSSCTELGCSFTDTSTDSDGSVVAWSWSFGDGETSTAQHPDHTYSSAGTYTVQLTVTDDGTATATASRSVTVSSPSGDPGAVTLSLTPSSTNQGSTWTATVTIGLSDGAGAPVSGVVVNGNWGTPVSAPASCTTSTAGTCQVSQSAIAKRTGSVTFTVTNADPDWNGSTSVTVTKP